MHSRSNIQASRRRSSNPQLPTRDIPNVYCRESRVGRRWNRNVGLSLFDYDAVADTSLVVQEDVVYPDRKKPGTRYPPTRLCQQSRHGTLLSSVAGIL